MTDAGQVRYAVKQESIKHFIDLNQHCRFPSAQSNDVPDL